MTVKYAHERVIFSVTGTSPRIEALVEHVNDLNYQHNLMVGGRRIFDIITVERFGEQSPEVVEWLDTFRCLEELEQTVDIVYEAENWGQFMKLCQQAGLPNDT